MLYLHSTAHRHVNSDMTSHTSILETPLQKHLPSNSIVKHKNLSSLHFSNKHKPLRIGLYKNIRLLSDVTSEFVSQDGSVFHTHRNHFHLFYPNDVLINT